MVYGNKLGEADNSGTAEVWGKEVSIEMLHLSIRRPKHKLGTDYTKWTKVQSEAGTIQSRDKLQETSESSALRCGMDNPGRILGQSITPRL